MKDISKKIIWLMVAVAIIVGGLAFYAGTKYAAKSKAGAYGAQARGGNAAFGGTARGQGRGGMAGANGAGFTGGKVLSKDATSVTVQARDGSSKVVFFTTATPVSKMVAGAQSDIAVGQEVTIVGTTNPDGSVSASSIQVRPATEETTKIN